MTEAADVWGRYGRARRTEFESVKLPLPTSQTARSAYRSPADRRLSPSPASGPSAEHALVQNGQIGGDRRKRLDVIQGGGSGCHTPSWAC